MKSKSFLAKVLSLMVVAGVLATCPASHAQTQKLGARRMPRSVSPATTDQSDPTPSVLIRMQMPGLRTGGQDIEVFAYEQQTTMEGVSFGGGGGGAGKLVAGPVTVSKRIDEISPAINQIHVNGEHMQEVTIQWFRLDPSGRSGQLFFTIKLTDVVISSIHRSLPNQQDPAFARLGETEAISFVYNGFQVISAGN